MSIFVYLFLVVVFFFLLTYNVQKSYSEVSTNARRLYNYVTTLVKECKEPISLHSDPP